MFSGVQRIIHLQEFGALLFCNGLNFEALRKDGLWWRSPRVSWDGIRNIRIEGAVLRGKAFDPTARENAWSDFTVDLMTGTCPDSRYREQMSRAIPVRPVET